MFKYFPVPCAIVDIETTGGNVTYDRITEIAIIEVTDDGIHEWSTLINPRVHIPKGIQLLTGITNEMVMSAPYFEQVAKEILVRLQGKLFVAHNVRFDYGFIRNEFARLAYPFKSKLMCTVRLSRFLYSDQDGHSLEKIISRHQIYVTHRIAHSTMPRRLINLWLLLKKKKARRWLRLLYNINIAKRACPHILMHN